MRGQLDPLTSCALTSAFDGHPLRRANAFPGDDRHTPGSAAPNESSSAMSLSSTSAAGIIRPDVVGPLIIEPLKTASTAMTITTNVSTLSPFFRLPIVVTDAAGGWYAEGSDLDLTDADVTEITVTPGKCAVLSKISNELANDSSPAAAQVVGEGMARDIARRLDAAFFGNTTANGPSGLQSLAGVQHVDGGTLADLDAFAEAISLAENVGSTVTAFCASAATVLHLSQLKAFDGVTQSNQPLLQPDPTLATRRAVLGVPLYSLPGTVIEEGVVWAIDKSKVFTVFRQDVSLEVDRSVFFGSDSIAVRAIVRVGYGFPHEASIIRIGVGGS
jgi:HK97 family phage major capsid protein